MNDTLHLKNSHSHYHCYNLVKKTFINGICEFKKSNYDVCVGFSKDNRHNGSYSAEQLEQELKKRVKDRREKITDLALNNSWEYFVTLTFDSNNLDYFPDGYSHERAIELLVKWINNQKHQNPSMSYLLVSEFHKKGHLHFHGLFKNVPKWVLVPAINPKNGKNLFISGAQIYNLSNYKHGFTTISFIKDNERVSHYVSKYVTKELVSLPNKKVFWYSRDLLKPKKSFIYTDSCLKDFLSTDNVNYYKKISGKERVIEFAVTKAT